MSTDEVKAAYAIIDDDKSGEIEFFEFEFWWKLQQKASIDLLMATIGVH